MNERRAVSTQMDKQRRLRAWRDHGGQRRPFWQQNFAAKGCANKRTRQEL